MCLEPVNVFGASVKETARRLAFRSPIRNHCIQNVVGAPLVPLGRGARPALPAAAPGTDGNR